MTGTRPTTRDPRITAPGNHFLLLRALIWGPLRDHPGRPLLALAAVALGVALGVAVHLVNSSALSEFELAARHLAGEADIVVRGPRSGFDEKLYPRIAQLPGVEAVNPALELEVPLAGHQGSLRIFGFDPLRAAQVQPSLLPERAGLVLGLFDADAILLSPAAAEALHLKAGDRLDVQVGTRTVPLRIEGLLPPGAYRQRIGVMDIASAQWRLGYAGRITRMDLRLKAGTNAAAFRRDLQALLPPGVHAVTPETEGARGAGLTRAYRLNLDMLALVALMTGAFLVFSSQMLAVLRRRPQLALLRALGVTRAELIARLIAEGATVGIVGSVLGAVAGYGLAYYALEQVGADLGAGYFRGMIASLDADPRVFGFFIALGTLFAALGAALPAWEAARRSPARALRAGDAEESLEPLRAPGGALACLASGWLLCLAPPVDDLPVAGYAAVAMTLLGAVLAMPWLSGFFLGRLPVPRPAPAAIAFAQLKATPKQAAVSLAAILVSFSLMVSMLIMVASFRGSLEVWLERMLPADLYLRTARLGETAYFTQAEQARIATTPGIARVEFIRSQNLMLAPERSPVTLLAGPVNAENPGKTLPLIGEAYVPQPSDPPPAWVSEITADLYGMKPGDRVQLPIGNRAGDKPLTFIVAGIWRDYARQNGSIAINRGLYELVTGDRYANDAALWLSPGRSVVDAQRDLRARLTQPENVEIATTREVRNASLALFDRTFAITYALEIAAVLIGLAGVSVSFGAQALARRREFGVLRHLGMTRREVGTLLACEGALVATLGAAFGLATGWAIGLILIHVVNRQSFHWSMELHVPWLPLAALAALLVLAAALTAVWSARAAMGPDVVRAVREDW